MGAHRLDLGEQVRGEQHGRARVVELGDDPPHVAGAGRVEAVGRLVEHHEPARHEQRGGEPEALLHAQRVAAIPAPGGVRQADPLQRRVHRRPQVAVEAGLEGRPAEQVVPPGQEGVEAGSLDERPDVGQGGHEVVTGPAEELDVARRGPGQAQQHPDQRGLAGAVRTEHADDRARGELQVDPVDGHHAPEGLAQAPRPGGGCGPAVGSGTLGGRHEAEGPRCRGHRPSASESTCSGTAPAAMRPSLVTIAVATAVVISRPWPQGPLTGVPRALRSG